MAVSKSILGMNARNFLYIRKYNSSNAKRIADDKLATKEILLKHHLPTPKLLAAFYHIDEIKNFNWELPADGFAIKPARGYGGGGILAIKSWDGEVATAVSGETYTKKQLQSHLLDIFDGAYSLQFLPDKAYIEALVTPSEFFTKLNARGIPDIRVIVFHKVPIMAMLRLPTKQSGSKANLHLGALGVGIDIRSGITTHALFKDRLTKYLPGTGTKIVGVTLPKWQDILLLASRAATASKLGYAGVDIVLDEKEGPLVLEVNARPGLAIQNVNLDSLRTRLERVEDMKISTPERGLEVAQSLFSEHFATHLDPTPKILTVIQPVMLHGHNHVRKKEVLAKLDSGAYRTSIDKGLMQELDLPPREEKVYVQSASGKAYRPTVDLTFTLGGKTIHSLASVVDRAHLRFPVIIGRRDLKGFLLKPEYGEFAEEEKEEENT